MNTESSNFSQAELDKFDELAQRWWDPHGPQKALHALNPPRLAYVAERTQLRDAAVLDVGCGGGLIAEPMRRMGFQVSAIDASSENIGTARAHADQVGLDIAYRAATVEQMVEAGAGPFDVVLTMEVIEHVADPEAFVRACSKLIKPGGLMIVATLNRTLKGLLLGKVAAEYVLRWVPAGTHDWRQFLKPEELRAMLDGEPLTVTGPYGLAYDPLNDRWSEGDDVGINYMMMATRDA